MPTSCLPLRRLTVLFASIVAVFGVARGAAAPRPAHDRPNIILIYSDDHGYADLAANGADPDIRTPHLDALARDGVRLVNGYVTAPQCVPSRAGVLTGRYQQRFGVEDNTLGPLPAAELTIAERLKPAGYVSAHVGKWHLEPAPRRAGTAAPAADDERAFSPGAQGFDTYYNGAMNTFLASHDLQGRPLPDAPRRLSDPRFRCVWQTDAALSFIDRHARDPFFLYLAYYTPHVPLESPEPWFSRTPAHLPLERRQALAMIAAMDDGIGRLRDRLNTLGLAQNTLVFFIGDNGAPLKDGAWNGSLNLPLTGEKGMLTDGGLRTPFLAAWPGTLPAGRTYTPPVIALDVAATAVAVAGTSARATDLDGVNLVPFLRGERTGAPHDALYWRWRSQAAVRDDRWKLILLGPTRKFLFDLASPEGETKDRLAAEPAVAAALERKLLAWDRTLPGPHLPRAEHAQDDAFFASHVLKTAPPPSKRARAAKGKTAAASAETSSAPARAVAAVSSLATPPSTSPSAPNASAAPAGFTQGWTARNCTVVAQDGVLRLVPGDGVGAKSARGFLTHAGLDLAGPMRATVRLRAPAGGSLAIAWRTAEERDFVAAHTARVALAASPEFQTVSLDVPAAGRVIHVRLHPPLEGPVDLALVEFSPSGAAAPRRWDFASTASTPVR